MTNPYVRQQNFTNWQTNNPGVVYNGTDLDNEFNAVATAVNSTIANLAKIQRADGAIANQSVGRDQLAASVVAGINTPAVWVTGHAYSQRDSVFQGSAWYWCSVPHTSGAFATDLAAGDWTLINDFSASIASIASGSFIGTSTTSATVGNGAKSFTTQANRLWGAGEILIVVDSANAANFMTGTVTSYNSSTGALVINIVTAGGSGTKTAWNISISGATGATGATGQGLAAGGATGQILSKSSGADYVTAWIAGGKVAQVVNTETAASTTGTTQTPWDDTIPQNTEGDQYLSLAVTPTNASSKLVIDAIFNFACSGADSVSLAMFQDSTSGAIAAWGIRADTPNQSYCATIRHVMSAGTTSATTIKLRCGPNGANTITFNGAGGNRKFGGVSASSLTITEILP